MDPISRKKLLTYLRRQEVAVVLITQRIDEAEDICDNIAIMSNGKFRDFGPPAYLKNRHGNGYQIKIELYSRNDEYEIDEHIQNQIPFCQRTACTEEESLK